MLLHKHNKRRRYLYIYIDIFILGWNETVAMQAHFTIHCTNGTIHLKNTLGTHSCWCHIRCTGLKKITAVDSSENAMNVLVECIFVSENWRMRIGWFVQHPTA